MHIEFAGTNQASHLEPIAKNYREQRTPRNYSRRALLPTERLAVSDSRILHPVAFASSALRFLETNGIPTGCNRFPAVTQRHHLFSFCVCHFSFFPLLVHHQPLATSPTGTCHPPANAARAGFRLLQRAPHSGCANPESLTERRRVMARCTAVMAFIMSPGWHLQQSAHGPRAALPVRWPTHILPFGPVQHERSRYLGSKRGSESRGDAARLCQAPDSTRPRRSCRVSGDTASEIREDGIRSKRLGALSSLTPGSNPLSHGACPGARGPSKSSVIPRIGPSRRRGEGLHPDVFVIALRFDGSNALVTTRV